jgi:CCR4-NOT transcriptional regulation complex NOT5 subunit
VSRYCLSIPSTSDPQEKAKHDLVVGLVDSMLSLHKQLAKARTGLEQALLQRQIEATDEQIDKLIERRGQKSKECKSASINPE